MTAALAAAIGPHDQFVVLGDGETRLLGDPEALASDASAAGYAWPTWLGDGSALCVSTTEYPGAAMGPRLLRVAADGSSTLELFRDPSGAALVGPRTPHYVNPSPDGRHLLALVPGANTLSLLLLDSARAGSAQPVLTGAPLFSAWSPRSDCYLLHTGAELTLTDLATAPAPRSLAVNHVGYRVPAWSPTGDEFAVSTPIGRRAALEVWDRDGVAVRSLGPSWNGVSLAWSPDGGLIAQAAQLPGDGSRFGRLQFVPAAGGEPRDSYAGPFVQMQWSPDGNRLALLVPDARDGFVAWLILDRNGRRVRRFPAFDPSPEFGLYTAFFDQYGQSHRLWSPDSTAILACGRVQTDGPPPEFLASCIYRCDIASGTMELLIAGSIASWARPAG
jgi:TolB protein